MAGWGCPHEIGDKCSKVNQLPCDPGMKGCVLAGRFVFASDDKNLRLLEKHARVAGAENAAAQPPPPASAPADGKA